MSNHRISIRLEDLAGDLQERIREIPVSVKRGLQSGTSFGRTLLSKKSPVDQGQLKNSWKLIDMAGGARGRSGMIQLVNEAPHAGIVERGARPHKVSQEGIEAIAQWVWRNRNVFARSTGAFSGRASGPVQPGTGGRRAMQRRADMGEATAIAYAIAWKIRRKGQKPTWFVRDSMPRISSMTRREVAHELERLAGTRFR